MPEDVPEGEGGTDELDTLLATALTDYHAHFGEAPYQPEGGFDPATRAKHAAILRMSIDENHLQAPESLCLSLGHPYPPEA